METRNEGGGGSPSYGQRRDHLVTTPATREKRRNSCGGHGCLSSLLELCPTSLEEQYWTGARRYIFAFDLLYNGFILLCTIAPGRTLKPGLSTAKIMNVLLVLAQAAQLLWLALQTKTWFKYRTLVLTINMLWHEVATIVEIPRIQASLTAPENLESQLSFAKFFITALWSSWVSSNLLMTFGYFVEFKYVFWHKLITYVASLWDLRGFCHLLNAPGYNEHVQWLYQLGNTASMAFLGPYVRSTCPTITVALYIQMMGNLVVPLWVVGYFQWNTKSKQLQSWRRRQGVPIVLHELHGP